MPVHEWNDTWCHNVKWAWPDDVGVWSKRRRA